MSLTHGGGLTFVRDRQSQGANASKFWRFSLRGSEEQATLGVVFADIDTPGGEPLRAAVPDLGTQANGAVLSSILKAAASPQESRIRTFNDTANVTTSGFEHIDLYGRLGPEAMAADAGPEDGILDQLGAAMLVDSGVTHAHVIPAAYTYFGQYLAHDMSFLDWSDTAQVNGVTGAWINARNLHALSFDSLFGTAPVAGAPTSTWIDQAGASLGRATPPPAGLEETFDLPRTAPGGHHACQDARVDSNLGLAQMHVLLVRFHQQIAALLNLSPDEARVQTRRHLQAVVLTDYLPKIVPPNVYTTVKNSGRIVVTGPVGDFLVPIEFAAAVFRFGHSMVGNTYPLWTIPWPQGSYMQSQAADLNALLAYTQAGGSLPLGKVAFHWAQPWRHMVEAQNPYLSVNGVAARPISACISGMFGALKRANFPDPRDPGNLAPFNLARVTLGRGRRFGLPSGQQVATLAGGGPLSVQQFLTTRASRFPGLAGDNALCTQTPLWFYTLAEAEAHGDGRLGPVGGRVVMETILAALLKSPDSIVTEGPAGQIASDFERKVRLDPSKMNSFSLTDVVAVAYGGVD